MTFYYHQSSGELEMYQRLIQYWTMIFSRKEKICVLDNMNFNLALFPQVIHPADVLRLHPLEPGYTSPDGSIELGQVIRELEYARLERADPPRSSISRRLVDGAGLGCGNGCSNVMNGVLNAVAKISQHRVPQGAMPEIVLPLPNYTVYTAQISNSATNTAPVYIYTKRDNNFLPTLAELEAVVTERTIACVLTYPNNPAQSSYEGRLLIELQKIVAFCQEREIFLIVDNIYQDLIFSEEHKFAEIFSLTSSLDYVVKVYGCSKDTPFFSGLRTGYWFGDPRIQDVYRYYISSTENSLNTPAMLMFALNLYFKTRALSGTAPRVEDMQIFSAGIFGWSQVVNEPELFERMMALDLYPKYRQRIAESNQIQSAALRDLIGYVKQSVCFSDYVNQMIGNVFFVKVNAEYFSGNDDAFFQYLFSEAQLGVLPGNVFGMPPGAQDVWFRMTTIHETSENLLSHLARMESFLLGAKQRKVGSIGLAGLRSPAGTAV